MKKTHVLTVIVCLACLQLARAQSQPSDRNTDSTSWPTRGWAKAQPASAGLDEKALAAFDRDIARGKYALVDTFAVYRCGKMVFDRKYSHDY